LATRLRLFGSDEIARLVNAIAVKAVIEARSVLAEAQVRRDMPDDQAEVRKAGGLVLRARREWNQTRDDLWRACARSTPTPHRVPDPSWIDLLSRARPSSERLPTPRAEAGPGHSGLGSGVSALGYALRLAARGGVAAHWETLGEDLVEELGLDPARVDGPDQHLRRRMLTSLRASTIASNTASIASKVSSNPALGGHATSGSLGYLGDPELTRPGLSGRCAARRRIRPVAPNLPPI
jgi:hypothetical protein